MVRVTLFISSRYSIYSNKHASFIFLIETESGVMTCIEWDHHHVVVTLHDVKFRFEIGPRSSDTLSRRR